MVGRIKTLGLPCRDNDVNCVPSGSGGLRLVLTANGRPLNCVPVEVTHIGLNVADGITDGHGTFETELEGGGYKIRAGCDQIGFVQRNPLVNAGRWTTVAIDVATNSRCPCPGDCTAYCYSDDNPGPRQNQNGNNQTPDQCDGSLNACFQGLLKFKVSQCCQQTVILGLVFAGLGIYLILS